MKRIVLATRNRGKLRELGRMLEGLGIELLPLDAFPGLTLPPETADTFRGNAIEKARFVHEHTGLPALADDSGLEVDSLGGRPGVRSARYAGEGATEEENWRKLLAELEGVAIDKRAARFRCAIAFVDGLEERVFEGTFEGVIAPGPSGAGGFGYDPVFFVPSEGRTVAEMSADEKNRISHRARALALFKDHIGRSWSGRE